MCSAVAAPSTTTPLHSTRKRCHPVAAGDPTGWAVALAASRLSQAFVCTYAFMVDKMVLLPLPPSPPPPPPPLPPLPPPLFTLFSSSPTKLAILHSSSKLLSHTRHTRMVSHITFYITSCQVFIFLYLILEHSLAVAILTKYRLACYMNGGSLIWAVCLITLLLYGE